MVPPEFAEESADARRQRERYNLMGTYSAAPARAAMIAMSTQQSAAAHVELSTAAGMIRVKVPGNILDEPKAEEPMAQPARRGVIRSLTHGWSLDPEEEGSVAHRVRELGHAFACILSGRRASCVAGVCPVLQACVLCGQLVFSCGRRAILVW